MGDNLVDSKYNSTVKVTDENKMQKNEQPQAPAQSKVCVPRGVIRVYQDYIPWDNRNNSTLLYLGKVLNKDYFIHPVKDLEKGIPRETKIVLISSNSYGNPNSTAIENSKLVMNNLESYVKSGGILLVNMADNLANGGYFAPGSYGTPDLIFPDDNKEQNLYLTREAYHTSFVNGPTITLTDENITMAPGYIWAAHGNLKDGIVIPKKSKILVTAVFGGVKKPVLAEYKLGCGFVILDTITKEFAGFKPEGTGPSYILINLFYYAFKRGLY